MDPSTAAASLRSFSSPSSATPSTIGAHAPPPSPSPSPSAQKQMMPGRWSDTLASTLGYSATTPSTAPPLQTSGSRGRRGRIPFWSAPPAPAEGSTEGEGAVKTGEGRKEDAEEVQGQQRDGGEAQEQRRRELEDLAERILWQASTTASGALLVIAGCHFPPPSPSLPHEALLLVLRRRLELLTSACESYTLVLLANPTPYPPATSLLVSTYLSLSQPTRKSLNMLFIVGGGWWLRVLLTLFTTTLLSRKTGRKIVQVGNLSGLAEGLGVEGFVSVEFPLQVYAANASIEASITLPPPVEGEERRGVFGVELAELMGPEGELGLPMLVRDCLAVLASKGPESVGVFRRSPSAANVKLLSDAYQRGHPVTLHEIDDAPYIAASLLKSFLRQLPSAIVPSSLYPSIRACPLPSNPTCGGYIRSTLLPLLPAPEKVLLQAIFSVLHSIAENSAVNLMDSNNLSILLAPNLIGQGLGEEELEMCRVPGMAVGTMRGVQRREKEVEGCMTLAGVVKGCLERHNEIFDPSLLASLSPPTRDAPAAFSSTTSARSISPRPSTSLPSSPSTSTSLSSPRSFAPIVEEGFSSSALPPTSPTKSTRTRKSPAASPPSSRRPSLASLYDQPASPSKSTSAESALSLSSRRGSHSSTSSLSSISSSLSLGHGEGEGGEEGTLKGKSRTLGRRTSLGAGGGTVRAKASTGEVTVDRDVRGVFALGGEEGK